MNRKIVRIAALLGVVCGIINATTEFRSPLSLQLYRGLMHYPLKNIRDTWLFGQMYPDYNKHFPWFIHTWSGGYYRFACKSFCDTCKDPCDIKCPTNCKDKITNFEKNNPCRDKTTSKTTGLSTLWFGKECFRGEEAFANGIIEDTVLLQNKNPFLGFARIKPRFDYNEWGVVFGTHIERRFGEDDKWRVGGRIALPFKVIEIEQQSCCNPEETLDDVVVQRTIQIDAGGDPNQVEYAYRLDFLSVLNLPVPGNMVPDNVIPVVRYGDGVLRTQVTGIDADGVTAGNLAQESGPPDQLKPPIYVIKRDCGEVPCPPFRRTFEQVSGGPLPVNGAGAAANDTVFFVQIDTNYKANLAQNRDAQSELFVIPRRLVATDNITNLANTIRQRIRTILDNLIPRETALEFFRENCIDFCKEECIKGLGNLDAEIYFGYGPEDWFANWFILGLRFPTDKRLKDPRRLYFQSTGNNGHYEIKLGMEGGWQFREWAAFKLDWFYNHAFKRSETRAAPFKGATVRNIGPCVKADVSWDYFVAHVDFNFFHPRNPDCGAVFGYELYAKFNDKVRLCEKTAVDLLGRERDLDAAIYETRTNAMTHKLRGEVFHRWAFCEIFAGGSHILAGKNAMKETEAHVGFAMYF